MAATITLTHTTRREGEQTVYFYEGEATAKDGKITVPTDRPEWVKRVWLLGYRIYRNKELATWPEVEAIISA
jgi:hypothetical protein